MKLNIGCGSRLKEGYINIDIANPNADIIADCTNLPFNSGTIDIIESYHLIEHMDRIKAEQALLHWYILLKDDGLLVLECPDISEVFKQFLLGDEEMLFSVYGRNRYAYDRHLWGYTPESLKKLLYKIGFKQIKHYKGTDYHSLSEPCLRMEALKC